MSSICDTTTCVPCDQFDNCGCLNPTTFECITLPGDCESLGITNDMNGKQVISQICTKFDSVVESQGKVLIDGTDTCPRYLFDMFEEGLNISFSFTGTGCDRKIVINAVEGGTPVDVSVKVSGDDIAAGYLYDKIDTGSYLAKSILNPSADEVLKIDVVPATLVSADLGNQLGLGSDGKLKTLYTPPDGTETKVVAGTGVTVTGTGPNSDPYIISINPSISVLRPCFDGIWRNITLTASGNGNVVWVSGNPQYRYRFDGTVEFRGSLTYNVQFGAYSTSNRRFTVPAGNIPTTCLTAGELAGVVDMKSINYIDNPSTLTDHQQYGYIIRRSGQNLILEFQSIFTNTTTKTIVVNFEGCVIHPSI